MRTIKPIYAVLLGFLGAGLGYIYIGRLAYAVLTLLIFAAFFSVVGWAGIALGPIGFYWVLALALCWALFPLVHSAMIAKKIKTVPKKWYSHWMYYVVWIITVGVLGNFVAVNRSALFGFETFSIPSVSMAPTLQRGDLIMVDTRTMTKTSPNVGEMVVFKASHGSPGAFFAKRIVGLPGDIIEVRNNALVRNGQPVEENYIKLSEHANDRLKNYGPTVVPKNHYFMMGDNRHNSNDSRFIGPIEHSLIHGKVVHRWFAFEQGVQWGRFPRRF
ncbi:MAG: signal peptidase I [Pseudomonadota bacterium]